MLARVHTLISASTCLFTSPMPSLRSANRNSEAVMLPLLSASSALKTCCTPCCFTSDSNILTACCAVLVRTAA